MNYKTDNGYEVLYPVTGNWNRDQILSQDLIDKYQNDLSFSRLGTFYYSGKSGSISNLCKFGNYYFFMSPVHQGTGSNWITYFLYSTDNLTTSNYFKQASGTSSVGFYFMGDDTLLAFVGGGTILAFEKGSTSYKTYTCSNGISNGGVYFNNTFIGTDGSRIYYSLNQGQTWQLSSFNPPGSGQYNLRRGNNTMVADENKTIVISDRLDSGTINSTVSVYFYSTDGINYQQQPLPMASKPEWIYYNKDTSQYVMISYTYYNSYLYYIFISKDGFTWEVQNVNDIVGNVGSSPTGACFLNNEFYFFVNGYKYYKTSDFKSWASGSFFDRTFGITPNDTGSAVDIYGIDNNLAFVNYMDYTTQQRNGFLMKYIPLNSPEDIQKRLLFSQDYSKFL